MAEMKPGDRLGTYEVVDVLGEGGMADVYLVRHTILAHKRAMKVLKPDLRSHADIKARFIEEGVALVALEEHANLPTAYDVLDDEMPAIVMEYLSGGDLTRHTLALDSILRVVRDTLEALSWLHKQGILHRDIKTANIFLAEDPQGVDRVVLMDFGIAKFGDLGQGAYSLRAPTSTGLVAGTPSFMAPEVHTRGLKYADARSDVYSVGRTLEVLLQENSIDDSMVDAHLNAILRRATEPSPSARYQSADDMHRALARLQNRKLLVPELQDWADPRAVVTSWIGKVVDAVTRLRRTSEASKPSASQGRRAASGEGAFLTGRHLMTKSMSAAIEAVRTWLGSSQERQLTREEFLALLPPEEAKALRRRDARRQGPPISEQPKLQGWHADARLIGPRVYVTGYCGVLVHEKSQRLVAYCHIQGRWTDPQLAIVQNAAVELLPARHFWRGSHIGSATFVVYLGTRQQMVLSDEFRDEVDHDEMSHAERVLTVARKLLAAGLQSATTGLSSLAAIPAPPPPIQKWLAEIRADPLYIPGRGIGWDPPAYKYDKRSDDQEWCRDINQLEFLAVGAHQESDRRTPRRGFQPSWWNNPIRLQDD